MPVYFGSIPVRVNPFFLVLIGLIGWINSSTLEGTLIWAAVIFFSVLVHEFGHALTAVFFNQKAEIELYGFGGVTKRRGPPLKLWQEFLIVLNGPLAGFFLFFLAYFIIGSLPEEKKVTFWMYGLEVMVYVNLFWTIVNLVPVHPLDGGHLLRIILEGMFGIKGIKVALFLSMAIAAGAGLFFLKFGGLLMGAVFFILAFESYRSFQGAMSLTDADRSEEMQERLKEAERSIRSGNSSLALKRLEELRHETKNGVIHNAATEYEAKVLESEGRFRDAYDLLNEISKTITPEGLKLQHQLAFKLQRFEEAIEIGNRVYQHIPNYQTAVLNALSHAILRQVQPAVGWLQTALNLGLPNLSEILKQKEFDHIRHDPDFMSFAGSSQN